MKDLYKPTFSLSLIYPKYWGVWIGFAILALFVNVLPYKLLYFIGRKLGQWGMKFSKKRVFIANRNLELAFPDMSEQERSTMVTENFKNTGLALIETGIAWFWPEWRFKRLLSFGDLEELYQFDQNKKGVLVCAVHALNLEITARAFSTVNLQGYGVYRPHNNPAYNFIQHWGRTHGGNQAIDRKDVKGMIRALRDGARIFYLPDHDYGRRKSVFVPFFAVDNACTTTGTSILAYTGQCAVSFVSGFRNNQGKYDLIAEKSVHEQYPQKDEYAAAIFVNQHVEKTILKAPEQWMWLHKRFKTMEDINIPKDTLYK
ncbi:LpxL/LpxP family Kdo(2)-lipid IV(A) lauroyl/palmitoleoyl acyltransferase [Vibrio sp. 99-8-1]|uniref:LpxL/LpxP family Kdo(2)-lipid IV(A) lauroyl/palmitoleoyl acyltransferase n=1 Tax=Vibrio sp. 99-8-1 TaxID=2607602 RepID=UPI001493A116|nr:LpxL/LpxP family Kdo(2)-lipid IV(A) lauroyl/palmitoleoyl acyltransferase [Vibrio sp. 99-8-1]NOI66980.1 LpxL/LpxP family Kdo(2)-lipid IV(A) lauroyl/palmitoleoyl acyltransferase [Vibrio sp. 99-8-1]